MVTLMQTSQEFKELSMGLRSRGLLVSPVLLFVLAPCLLPVALCHGEQLPVAASIFPVADMVKQVGGDHVDVITIIPPGASPHTFSLRPRQVEQISAARVVFLIGAGFESWTEKLVPIGKHPDRGIVLSDDVELIRGIDRRHSHDDSPAHAAGSANPHIWLDPENAKIMVSRIVDALVRADPKNRDDYMRRGNVYRRDLDNLSSTIRETVAGFGIKRYVSLHSAWDYFALRYGIESVGTIEASPGRHPTPKTVLEIVKQIRKHNIKAVFAEPQLDPRIAEVIARQAEARVLMLDPLGGPELAGRDTYASLMKYNLGILQEAME